MENGKRMAKLGTLVAVAAMAACSGCRHPVPGDGRLVLVQVDDALAALPVNVAQPDGTLAQAQLGDYIAQGVRYWDATGARLRTPEQVTADDGEPAATLQIVVASSVDHSLDGAPAFYADIDGQIHVDPAQFRAKDGTYYAAVEFAAMFAHEAGHALGLDHEPGCTGVMSQQCWLPALTDADVAQFGRVAR